MDYVSHYTNLIYFANGGISVCRYRLLALASDPKQVVIQVENHGGQKDILISDHIVRDGVLNRIADRDLTGVPFDMLCVALTEAGQHHIVFVEADLEDYIHRGYLAPRWIPCFRRAAAPTASPDSAGAALLLPVL